jgi:hypothetical protein
MVEFRQHSSFERPFATPVHKRGTKAWLQGRPLILFMKNLSLFGHARQSGPTANCTGGIPLGKNFLK